MSTCRAYLACAFGMQVAAVAVTHRDDYSHCTRPRGPASIAPLCRTRPSLQWKASRTGAHSPGRCALVPCAVENANHLLHALGPVRQRDGFTRLRLEQGGALACTVPRGRVGSVVMSESRGQRTLQVRFRSTMAQWRRGPERQKLSRGPGCQVRRGSGGNSPALVAALVMARVRVCVPGPQRAEQRVQLDQLAT